MARYQLKAPQSMYRETHREDYAEALQTAYDSALTKDEEALINAINLQAAPFTKDQKELVRLVSEYTKNIKERSAQGDYEYMLKDVNRSAQQFKIDTLGITSNKAAYDADVAALNEDDMNFTPAQKAARLKVNKDLYEQSGGYQVDPATGQVTNLYRGQEWSPAVNLPQIVLDYAEKIKKEYVDSGWYPLYANYEEGEDGNMYGVGEPIGLQNQNGNQIQYSKIYELALARLEQDQDTQAFLDDEASIAALNYLQNPDAYYSQLGTDPDQSYGEKVPGTEKYFSEKEFFDSLMSEVSIDPDIITEAQERFNSIPVEQRGDMTFEDYFKEELTKKAAQLYGNLMVQKQMHNAANLAGYTYETSKLTNTVKLTDALSGDGGGGTKTSKVLDIYTKEGYVQEDFTSIYPNPERRSELEINLFGDGTPGTGALSEQEHLLTNVSNELGVQPEQLEAMILTLSEAIKIDEELFTDDYGINAEKLKEHFPDLDEEQLNHLALNYPTIVNQQRAIEAAKYELEKEDDLYVNLDTTLTSKGIYNLKKEIKGKLNLLSQEYEDGYQQLIKLFGTREALEKAMFEIANNRMIPKELRLKDASYRDMRFGPTSVNSQDIWDNTILGEGTSFGERWIAQQRPGEPDDVYEQRKETGRTNAQNFANEFSDIVQTLHGDYQEAIEKYLGDPENLKTLKAKQLKVSGGEIKKQILDPAKDIYGDAEVFKNSVAFSPNNNTDIPLISVDEDGYLDAENSYLFQSGQLDDDQLQSILDGKHTIKSAGLERGSLQGVGLYLQLQLGNKSDGFTTHDIVIPAQAIFDSDNKTDALVNSLQGALKKGSETEKRLIHELIGYELVGDAFRYRPYFELEVQNMKPGTKDKPSKMSPNDPSAIHFDIGETKGAITVQKDATGTPLYVLNYYIPASGDAEGYWAEAGDNYADYGALFQRISELYFAQQQ
tara:strand:+ start:691 stop:3525 length:2835 start_codon:yes stop_codon:yes gene_type:complete